MPKQPLDHKAILDFHSTVQGVANVVADLLGEAISGQDTALLSMLQTELRTIRERIVHNQNPLRSSREIFNRLKSIQKQIVDISHRGVQRAAKIMQGEMLEFARQAGRYAAEEVQAILGNESALRRRLLKNELSDTQIRNMLHYKPFVDGRTIGQWFQKLEYDNASRIFQRVQQGVIGGYKLNDILQTIRGKRDGTPGIFDYGVLEANRRSAETLARTAVNAVANQSRMEMYQANIDVLDGVQWLGTLDHRTCIICGSYDGTIWTSDKMHEVQVPPAHPNCRCVLIPYIDIGERVSRPAEAENFDRLAKEAYERDPKSQKNWDELSYDYRRQLRYQAIKDFTKETGQKPYAQMPGKMTFADYLAKQPAEWQREWLGASRYEMYKKGKLTLDHMVNPDGAGHNCWQYRILWKQKRRYIYGN